MKVKPSKEPDQIFTFEGKELGLLEAAKSTDEKGNKNFGDGFIKGPNLMKDFLLQLVKEHPELTHAIRVPCFLTSGKLKYAWANGRMTRFTNIS